MPSKTLGPVIVGLSVMSGTALAGDDPLKMPEDLSAYHYVNSLVINDEESPLFGFHQFYVNDQGLKPLLKGESYPAGTVFIGMVYDVVQDGEQYNDGKGRAVTMMKKVEGAQATGGWRFAQFDPRGRAMDINEVQDCFTCHTQVKDQDYVFSQPLSVGDLNNLSLEK